MKPQKKVIFLMAVPLKGEGGKGLAIKKKNTLFGTFFKFAIKIWTAIKIAAGGTVRPNWHCH